MKSEWRGMSLFACHKLHSVVQYFSPEVATAGGKWAPLYTHMVCHTLHITYRLKTVVGKIANYRDTVTYLSWP